MLVLGIIELDGEGLWSCRVDVPEANAKPLRIFGEDPLQALHLALKFLQVSIETSNQSGFVELFWFSPGDNCGFA